MAIRKSIIHDFPGLSYNFTHEFSCAITYQVSDQDDNFAVFYKPTTPRDEILHFLKLVKATTWRFWLQSE